MTTTENQLREIVSGLGDFGPDFDSKAHFFHDLEVASARALELLMSIEDTFSVMVPDDDFNEVINLEQLIALVERLKQEAG